MSHLRDAHQQTRNQCLAATNSQHWLEITIQRWRQLRLCLIARRFAPWIVVQLLPKMQRIVRGRYRSRSDAEGHLTALQRQLPQYEFVMMFDGG